MEAELAKAQAGYGFVPFLESIGKGVSGRSWKVCALWSDDTEYSANIPAVSDEKSAWHFFKDVRFALPVYDDKSGEVFRYNVFFARMLVRHDADGKKYLYACGSDSSGLFMPENQEGGIKEEMRGPPDYIKQKMN